jgi:drug/metabolite transporter (DMT)-like permease
LALFFPRLRVESDASLASETAMQSLWMIVASLLFACMGVCVKLAAENHSAVEIVFYRSALALLPMLALARLRGVELRTPHWRWQLSRAAFGFAAVIAYFSAITLLPLATAMTRAYAAARTLTAAALAYSTVVFASLFGIFLWNETYDGWSWLAMALIVLSGLAATQFAPIPEAKPASPAR